jgi:tetratricopeptide (TPR) repeat protein
MSSINNISFDVNQFNEQLFDIISNKIKSGDWSSTISFIRTILKFNRNELHPEDLIKVELILGDLLWKTGMFSEGKTIFELCLDSSSELKIEKLVADSLYHLGEIHYIEEFLMTKDVTSENMHLKSLQLREKISDKKGIIHSLSRLGVIYERRKEYEKSLNHYNKALSVSDDINYALGKTRPYTHIGVYHFRNNELDKAYEFHLKALTINKKLNNVEGIIFNLVNLGNMYYEFKKDFDKSIEMCNDALDLAMKTGFQLAIIRSHHMLGQLYGEEKYIKDSINHFSLLKELAEQNNYVAYYQLAKSQLETLKLNQQ